MVPRKDFGDAGGETRYHRVKRLITPSLEEMAVVATEMEKAGFKLPLLIGGATTSKLHTALKIEPKYSQGVVHVKDASQSPSAVANLINPQNRDGYIQKVAEEYQMLRDSRLDKKIELVSLAEARAHAFTPDWSTYEAAVPNTLGRVQLDLFPSKSCYRISTGNSSSPRGTCEEGSRPIQVGSNPRGARRMVATFKKTG